ncbi:MAG TPA: hypothetical protein VM166_10420 [Gemmatimonadaceae bacterium]|nr:hypothetical protein [Gemmatimonadaceae bacterium]
MKLRKGFCLISGFGVAACTAPATITPRTTNGGFGVQVGPQLGLATKRVMYKQAPETLVADDGTVCRVAPDRYASTEVKAMVSCEWQPGEPRK